MKNLLLFISKPIIFAVVLINLTGTNVAFAKYEFGNIILNKYEKEMKMEKQDLVVFPHWIHTLWYKCKACHNKPFQPMAGSNDITMAQIDKGEKCGLCHNGESAFSQKECKRCHSLGSEASLTLKTDEMTKRLYPGIFTTKLTKGKEKKNKNLKFADPKEVSIRDLKSTADKLGVEFETRYITENGFPRNRLKTIDYNRLVLRDKIVKPKGAVPGKVENKEVKNNYIIFEVLSDFVDNVVFSHNKHSYLINCDTCHEKLFKSELGVNLVHMREIAAGKYCGFCHNKVAFPLALCPTCHRLPRGEKKNILAKGEKKGDWPGEIIVRDNPLLGKKLSVSTKRGEGLSILGEKTKADIANDKKEIEMSKKRRKAERKMSRSIEKMTIRNPNLVSGLKNKKAPVEPTKPSVIKTKRKIPATKLSKVAKKEIKEKSITKEGEFKDTKAAKEDNSNNDRLFPWLAWPKRGSCIFF